MKQLQVQTVDGEQIELSYDPGAGEGQRYRVNGRPVIQSPRLVGEGRFELWVTAEGKDHPYDIYRITAGALQQLRDAPDVAGESV